MYYIRSRINLDHSPTYSFYNRPNNHPSFPYHHIQLIPFPKQKLLPLKIIFHFSASLHYLNVEGIIKYIRRNS